MPAVFGAHLAEMGEDGGALVGGEVAPRGQDFFGVFGEKAFPEFFDGHGLSRAGVEHSRTGNGFYWPVSRECFALTFWAAAMRA